MNANGTAIRALRQARNLSMAELAKASGCSQPFLSRLERGEVGASNRTLEALAEQLDVAVTDLIKGDTVTPTDVADLSDLRCYKAEQVAEMFDDFPVSWLEKQAAARAIPCTYIGKYLRFSVADIRELIEMHRIDPATAMPRQRSA